MDLKRRNLLKMSALSAAGATAAVTAFSLKNEKVVAEVSSQPTGIKLQIIPSEQGEQQAKNITLTFKKAGKVPEAVPKDKFLDDEDSTLSCSCSCASSGGAGAG